MWEFWTDWLPTETPFSPHNVDPRHKWDRVGDLMGMHGQGGSAVQSSLEFAASHYGMITTAAPCGKQGEGTTTIEDGTLALVRQTASLCPPR